MGIAVDSAKLIERTKGYIAERMAALEPEGDIMPAAVFLDGIDRIVIVSIAGSYMEDEQTKDNLAVHMRKLARQHRAIACAFLFVGWRREDNQRNEEGGIAGLEGTTEWAAIQEIVGGEVTLHFAEIIRFTDAPPRLGSWEKFGKAEGRAEGRFVEALVPVLSDNYSAHVN